MSARPRIQTEPLRISAEEEPGHSYSQQSWINFAWLIFWIAALIALIKVA